MAEQPIQIEVTFDGASEATRELGRVSQGISNVGQTADRAGVTVESFSRGFQNTAQRVQGVASAVQTLASSFGSENRTGSLVASVAGATAQFAAMGAMLGPAGAVIGGLVGATSSIYAMAQASDEAATAASRHADALRRVAQAREEASLAMAERAVAGEGSLSGLSDEELEAHRLRRAEARLRAEADIDSPTITTELLRSMGLASSEETLAGAIRQLDYEIGNIDAEIERRRDEARRELEADLAESDERIEAAMGRLSAPASRRRGGGVRRAAAPAEAASPEAETRLDAMRFFAEAELEITEDTNNRLIEMREARDELLASKAEEAAQLEIDIAKRQYEELARLGEEQEQERIAADERAIEHRQSMMNDLGGMMAQTTMMLGKSVAAIATGEQTAEQAFEGMAKSFLEMIAQYAAMKAATEFADAIASFARYDYSGGAQHIAAGVAFTAVAVATGVGAAAIGSAPSAPARPEAGGGTEAAQGGDVVINWNSPVITAGTQAELGRELQAAVSAAGSI